MFGAFNKSWLARRVNVVVNLTEIGFFIKGSIKNATYRKIFMGESLSNAFSVLKKVAYTGFIFKEIL